MDEINQQIRAVVEEMGMEIEELKEKQKQWVSETNTVR